MAQSSSAGGSAALDPPAQDQLRTSTAIKWTYMPTY
jgi:hypothetical protein